MKTAVTRARQCLLAAALLLAAAGAHAGIFCRVTTTGGSGAGHDGSGWDDAHAMTLQAALSTANCIEIWVAQGVYKPTATADRTISFAINRTLKLYGGFAGSETSSDQRDPRAHRTVLSGDIDGNDTDTDGNHIAETTADLQGANSYHVVVIGGLDPENGNGSYTPGDTVIDGFTITGGQATGTGNHQNSGGGLQCNGAGSGHVCSPTLRRLVFSGNYAGGPRTGAGGAIYNNGLMGTSSPTLTDVSFNGNGTVGDGGAMYNSGSLGISSPTLTNVSFSGNSAGGNGGAMFNYGGGGNSSPSLVNVTFSGNRAGGDGGAMYNNGGGGNSSPSLTHVTFSGNSAGNRGGAMVNDGTFGGTSRPTLTNVILVDDTAGENPEIHNYGAGTATLNNSLVYSTATSSGACPAGNTCGSSGMVYAAPKLGPLQDNGGATPTMLPAAGSAAIDAGTCTGAPATDQRGVARPQGSTCDIGAVEVASRALTVQVLGVNSSVSAGALPAPLTGGIAGCTGTNGAHCAASYAVGATVTLTATAESGRHVVWGGDCSGSASTCDLTLDQDRHATAAFVLNTYTVTTATTPDGTGTLTCEPVSVAHGSTTLCTPAPNTAAGYELDSMGGTCGGTLGEDGRFTAGPVTADCTVTATFKLKTYAITAAVAPAGAGTLTCEPASMQHGGGATCTATAADAGFTLAGFDGGCVRTGDSNQCTLSNVQADTTVTARFAPVTTFNGTTVPAGESASASFTGGGESCRFDTETAFIAPPAAPPEGQTLPQGMFHFKLIGCEPGSTVAMSVTWPRPVAGYVKYGPAASGAQPGYFEPTALAIDGRTVTFTVQDGALGDDDWATNGAITDPSGPATRVALVPTLGAWGLLLLSLLAGVLGVLARRRKV